MPSNPYADLPARAYWRTGVAEASRPVPEALHIPKWPIDRTVRIATAGSCFAQHIGRHLRTGGFRVLDLEPAPQDLPAPRHAAYGYGLYSARYGNVYTARQMLQLVREATGEGPRRDIHWHRDGRWYDGLRPGVEPKGLPAPQIVAAHRIWHLTRVRALLERADLLIFTLGLTEAWTDAQDGTVFPVCPGVAAGDFDPARHLFRNFGVAEIRDDLLALRETLARLRPSGRPPRLLLTVSPVPLTATASGAHVQVATVRSKSVLRAVAGELAEAEPDIDYFPSYEIVTSPWSGARFYAANQRSVTADGVAAVMAHFTACYDATASGAERASPSPEPDPSPILEATQTEDEAMLVQCDEDLLDAFGPGSMT